METDVIVRTDVDEAEKAEIAAATAVASTTKRIPLNLIEVSDVSLRGVHRNTEAFQQLVQSIRSRGVYNSILVRELQRPTGIVYGLIDGLQRYTGSLEAGCADIPANIVAMSDAEMLEAQIITNTVHIETRPADLSKHLLRMLARDPLLTTKSLAEKLCKSETWVNQRLSLSKLLPNIQLLVNDGQINLVNAYILSKIPQDEQATHVDAAMLESPLAFVPRMKERIAELKKASQTGTDAGPAGFVPQPHLRKLGELKAALSDPSAVLSQATAAGIDNVKSAIEFALAWALSYDPQSKQAAIVANQIREEKRAAKAELLKKEKEARKQDRAATEAADLTKL
jgi:ParB/RepB/Spo0J family partition protein